MPVVMFPMTPAGDFCLACGQQMAKHGKRCVRDIALDQDDHALARRLRLARLQIGRGLKVKTVTDFVAEGV